MSKRVLSSRGPQEQAIKRVNSKEDLTLVTASEPEELNAVDVVPGRKISNAQELEETLKDTTTQERAMKALSQAHCAESLACLIELFRWEQETDDVKKKTIEDKIVLEFMTKDVPNEIFVPETIRLRVKEGKGSLSDVKGHVLSDLRFNSTLLKAIGTN